MRNDRKRLAWQLVRPYGRYLYYLLRLGARPAYFDAPWSLPVRSLDSGSLERGSGPQNLAFVFFPMVDWHVRMQRPQQLALALASLGHTCIYVNPQLGCEYRMPYLLDPQPKVGRIGDRILELHVHLPREHESHTRPLLAREARRVVSAVGDLLAQCGIANAMQIVSFPRWNCVAAAIRREYGFPVLYDCHDRLDAFRRISREIVELERESLDAADLLTFSSKSLMQSMLAEHPRHRCKSSVIGNGVTPADFPARPPAPGGPPVIGYAGALEEWFDVDSVVAAARSLPECRFQILGRVEHPKLNELRRLRNLELTGEVPYAALPDYLRQWSVAMIPFLINRVTSTVDPIKLYEYFSLGLPVVTAPLAEIVRRYPELVYFGRGPEEFAARLRDAIAEPDGPRRQMRRDVAARENWTSRARAILALTRAMHQMPRSVA